MSSIAMSPFQFDPRVAWMMITKSLYVPISIVAFFQLLPCDEQGGHYLLQQLDTNEQNHHIYQSLFTFIVN